MGLFQKKKKTDMQPQFAENIQEEEYRPEHRPSSREHYIVECCEQVIDISRELEDARREYQLVTAYLNDIESIEGLPEDIHGALVDAASRISKLNGERKAFLKTEQKLSDTMFSQLQEEEDEMPATIKRLQANETYLDGIKKDMHFLEGEKLEWDIERKECRREQSLLRGIAFVLLGLFSVTVLLLLLLYVIMEVDTQLYMLISAFLATLCGAYTLVRYQNCTREIKRCDLNRNQAISLENHVKLKYVNIKNAVDYTCEKFQVKNSYELIYYYELYQEAVREQEKFRRTNDDLQFFCQKLIRILEEEKLYDARVWVHHANALIDPREMVELKHNLLVRRQKVRSRVEYNIKAIADLKNEITEQMRYVDSDMSQVADILTKIDAINRIS